MRYYKIKITDPNSGQVITPPGFSGLGLDATYTSYVNGQTLPGAWNVEMDITAGPASSPMGGSYVRVWGISLKEIAQANDLVNKNIEIYGGMQKGLPLANPKQAGLLVKGFVFQAFGNWVDTSQTLDLIIQPGPSPTGTGAITAPINLTLNWLKGQTLGAALKTALGVAFPKFAITDLTSASLVRGDDQIGVFQTVTQIGQWAKQMSKSIVKTAGYNGVEVLVGDDAITLYDGTQQQGQQTAQIAFTDLIGQPTWIEAPSIQVKCVMRADLKIGQLIKLPQTVVTNTAQAQSSLVPNQRVTFQGQFMIQQMRHVGNYRQPDAASWATIINAAPTG